MVQHIKIVGLGVGLLVALATLSSASGGASRVVSESPISLQVAQAGSVSGSVTPALPY